MFSESIRFNEGELIKKNRGQTIPEEVYSVIQAAAHTQCVVAENRKEHRDTQEDDKGRIFWRVVFCSCVSSDYLINYFVIVQWLGLHKRGHQLCCLLSHILS